MDAWNLVTQEQTVSFAGGLENVASLTASPSQIALGVEDRIEILNANGEKILEIDSPGDHTLLAFNADGSMLASSNSTGFIEIWKLEDGAASLVGSIQKESVESMAFKYGRHPTCSWHDEYCVSYRPSYGQRTGTSPTCRNCEWSRLFG